MGWAKRRDRSTDTLEYKTEKQCTFFLSDTGVSKEVLQRRTKTCIMFCQRGALLDTVLYSEGSISHKDATVVVVLVRRCCGKG